MPIPAPGAAHGATWALAASGGLREQGPSVSAWPHGAGQGRCTEGGVSKKLHVQSQGHPGRPGTWSEGCPHWQRPWALGTLTFPSSSQTSESLWNDFLDREQRSGKAHITRWSTTSKKWQGSPRAPQPARLSAGKGLGNTCAEKTPGASQRQKDPPEATASGTSLHT